jgi:hypothetical protein
VAYACTALATLSTNRTSAVAGDTVTVSGKGFAPHDASDIRSSPAVVRMDSASGPVLAQASPSSNSTGGTFSTDITVPKVDAGEHVIVVTQNGIDGRPAFGTPARTVLTVDPTPVPVPAAQSVAPVAESAAVSPPAAVIAPFVAPPVAARAAAPSASLARARALARARTRTRAIASCRTKYSAKRSKTKAGKRRMAIKRSSCIRAANRAAV